MLSTGAKRFLEKAVREAANFVERKARKKKEKSPSPKLREQSPGGGVRSDSNLDFLGSLASPVDTIVWATVDSGAATSCLPKEMAQSLELAMTPVDEKPFAMHQDSQSRCTAYATPWWQWVRKEAHKSKVWDSSGQWMWQSHCYLCPSWLRKAGQWPSAPQDRSCKGEPRRYQSQWLEESSK